MDKENPWGKDGTGKDVDLHLYRSMIGSLMYLTASIPDIMLVVCACARHQVTTKECHLHAVKRIFRYLKGHPKLGLWYPKDSPFDLVAYSDSDYGGASQNRKSTTRGSQFLGRSLRLIPLGEFNTDFHPMVDFIEASPLRIETMDEGTHILATVDGIQRTVSESSLRRNLKLRDEDGIVSIPDTELFENLTLMGYNISQNQKFTFQKGQFSHQWKYLIHTIMQCLSPKSTGFNEFSSNIATAPVCLATNKTYNFSKMIFDGEGSGTPTEPHHTPSPEADTSHPTTSSIPLPSLLAAPIPPVTQTDTTPIRQYSRRARIAHEGEACPIESGFIADRDRATIAKSSTLPHDSAPRVTSPAVDEGSIQHNISKLTALCTSLQRQHSELLAKFQAQEVEILRLKEMVQVMEDRESVAAKQSVDDALIKGRKELARVLTSMDAATVLAGGIDV
nr:hypothetical protein [Tanacetum cinerariifolium]